MPSLSWKKAAQLAGLDLTKEEKAADDWPAAFDLKQITILQYPGDGTRSGGRAAQQDRKALFDVLAAAVKEGGVLTEQRAREVKAFKKIPVRECPYERIDKSVSGVSNEAWEANGGRFAEVPNGFETVYYDVVLPAGLCDWFAEKDEEPSVHIQAWVGSSVVVDSEVRPNSQAGIVVTVLAECKRRADSKGISFDLMDMPGQKVHLFELLRRLEPSFKNMVGVQSLDRYLKGVCTWSLRAKSNPDATPLYQELFPEAWGNPGATSENRKKA